MSITTNTTPAPGSGLEAAAQRLLEAAQAYYLEYRKAGLAGAVVWVQDTTGRLVILTRGEYRAELLGAVNGLGDVRFGD